MRKTLIIMIALTILFSSMLLSLSSRVSPYSPQAGDVVQFNSTYYRVMHEQPQITQQRFIVVEIIKDRANIVHLNNRDIISSDLLEKANLSLTDQKIFLIDHAEELYRTLTIDKVKQLKPGQKVRFNKYFIEGEMKQRLDPDMKFFTSVHTVSSTDGREIICMDNDNACYNYAWLEIAD